MQRVRQQIQREHRETISDVVSVGSDVAGIGSWPVTDGEVIRRQLDAFLCAEGLDQRLPAMLETGAAALGTELQGKPVAAPPYLVVTSRGILCRGTLADGRRLVIELHLFTVERRPRRYRFRDADSGTCLRVRVENQ